MLATATPADTGPPVSAKVETRPVRLLYHVDELPIAEARRQGLRVPEDENAEEFHPIARKRLGWYWAYDDTRRETREEREQRYLADERIVDMKGLARILLRSYASVKDLNFESDAARGVLEDEDNLHRMAEELMKGDPTLDRKTANAIARADAEKRVLKALPRRRGTAGGSPIWEVRDGFTFGRKKRAMLTDWYEYAKIKQTGRPKGSKTRHRRATS